MPDFEMLRLTPDFEMLRLMCDFKTLRLTPTRNQPDATLQNIASEARQTWHFEIKRQGQDFKTMRQTLFLWPCVRRAIWAWLCRSMFHLVLGSVWSKGVLSIRVSLVLGSAWSCSCQVRLSCSGNWSNPCHVTGTYTVYHCKKQCVPPSRYFMIIRIWQLFALMWKFALE